MTLLLRAVDATARFWNGPDDGDGNIRILQHRRITAEDLDDPDFTGPRIEFVSYRHIYTTTHGVHVYDEEYEP